MIELPICQYRSKAQRPDGCYKCATPHMPQWVPPETCTTCMYHDNGPLSKKTLRPQPTANPQEEKPRENSAPKIMPPIIRTPRLVQQIASAAKAVTKFVAKGMPLISKEQVAERLAICAACPQYDKGRCKLCGCYLQAKIRMATEQCPINKWPKIETQPSKKEPV